MYTYLAEVVRVVDGDTVVFKVDLGFKMTTEQSFRLYGIDTPELRSRDPNERERAQAAKAFVQGILPVGEKVTLVTHKADKYGRWLAEVYSPHGIKEPSVNKLLVSHGHAIEYFGGRRKKKT